jgi:hypothetical protein
MRKQFAVLITLCAVLVTGAFAQQSNPYTNTFPSALYSQWVGFVTSGNSATGSQTITATTSGIAVPNHSGTVNPFQVNLPIYVESEVVTPSTVSCSFNAQATYTCQITASFSNTHGNNAQIHTAYAGVPEAAYDASLRVGGLVTVDGQGITSSALATALGALTAYSNVVIQDNTGGAPQYWFSNGTNYALAGGPGAQSSGNGSYWQSFANTALMTLSTGGTTTDSSTNLLPANSLIDAVVGTVTTTITSACTGWALGDSGSGTRFAASNTTLTAGTKSVGLVQWTGTVAPTQASAAKVRITCAGGNPGAGAVRVTVYGRTFVAPAN